MTEAYGHGLTPPGSLISFQSQPDALTYETFFGLKEKPFSLNSDPRFLYHSPSHAVTFENLLAGIRRREGLLVLTGEIGIGKTTLCRAVLRSLGRKTFSSFVPDPFASREDLLKMLLIDFGVLSIQDLTTGTLKHASRTELSYLLSEFFESLAPLDAFVVVIIDEAQKMSLPLIEETRILSDSFGSKGHLQIVFVGQPELHATLKLPEMRQVDQRICGYNRLVPLSQEVVAACVQHRLHVAGGSRERVLFPPDVIEILHQRSGGVPRLINRICDRALHLAHQRQAPGVDREILETALIDLGPTTLTPTWASIISTAPEVVKPPTTPVETAPPVEEANTFSRQVDEWLMHELPPTGPEPTALHEFDNETPEVPAAPPTPAKQVVRRHTPALSLGRALHVDLRPETYMRRLGRMWAKRAAIAAVCVMAIKVAVMGASYVPTELAGLLLEPPTLPTLPALPAQPALAVPGVASPAMPPLEMPPDGVTGDYLVAVGIFGSRERADRLVESLTEAGLRASHRPIQLRTQRVRQVVLGPYVTRADAVADLRRLRQLGGFDDANVIEVSSSE
jgi:general secretion pathway protein A